MAGCQVRMHGSETVPAVRLRLAAGGVAGGAHRQGDVADPAHAWSEGPPRSTVERAAGAHAQAESSPLHSIGLRNEHGRLMTFGPSALSPSSSAVLPRAQGAEQDGEVPVVPGGRARAEQAADGAGELPDDAGLAEAVRGMMMLPRPDACVALAGGGVVVCCWKRAAAAQPPAWARCPWAAAIRRCAAWRRWQAAGDDNNDATALAADELMMVGRRCWLVARTIRVPRTSAAAPAAPSCSWWW